MGVLGRAMHKEEGRKVDRECRIKGFLDSSLAMRMVSSSRMRKSRKLKIGNYH